MDWLTILEIAGVAAAVAVIVLVFSLLGLISRLKQTLGQVDKTLQDVSTIVSDLDVELKPVISSAQESLDRLAALSKKSERLVEEVGALPPTVKELALTFKDILRDLSGDLKETLVKGQNLIEEAQKRLSGEVPELLQEVDRLAEELNAIVADVHQKLAKTDELFKTVEEAGRASKLVARIISKNIAEAAVEVAAVATGLRTTLKVLREKLTLGGDRNV